MYDYDISIIIPIYNYGKFIDLCMETLFNQTHDFERIQIVMVNDGSTDDSEKYCVKYANKYKNVLYFYQENSGVSAARNLGIKNAAGKYIMFLDADDTLSENAVKDIFKFFEDHYEEVDLVTYKLEYQYESGRVRSHARYKILDHTGIYSLVDDIYINQTTMNICVKNSSAPLLFDESLYLGEDQLYIVNQLTAKMKIGFVKDAVYFYYRHSASVSSEKNHPFYCYDQFKVFIQKLLYIVNNNHPEAKGMICALILYNLNWRLCADKLLPYHYSNDKFAEEKEKFADLLRFIGLDIILSAPEIHKYHKSYFIREAGLLPEINTAESYYTISSNDSFLTNGKRDQIVFNKLIVLDDKFYISGYLKSLLNDFRDVKLVLKRYDYCTGEEYEEEVPCVPSSYSTFRTRIKTNKFLSFKLCIPYQDEAKIWLMVKYNNNNYYPTFFTFSKNLILSRARHEFMVKGYSVQGKEIKAPGMPDYFYLKKLNWRERIKHWIKLENNLSKKNIKRFIYRRLGEFSRKEIWIYMDRYGVLDNAYYQFKHDIQIEDGVKRYYIQDSLGDLDSLFTKEEIKHVIPYKSYQHKYLYLNCTKLITSFSERTVTIPFDLEIFPIYQDLIRHEVIYLQHGILHAHLPQLYSADRASIDKIVVSSEFEINNFTNNYRYSKENLIPSGMPRLDYISKKTGKPSNKILYVPSWRKNLVGDYKNNRREMKPDKFLKSSFYKETAAFLTSSELHDFLEDNNLVLQFKNHPNFSGYDKYYKELLLSERVEIVDVLEEAEQYCLVITDYSSIIYDYVYLVRPIIYFIPDYDEFRSGLTHTYRLMDDSFDEGFGRFTESSDDLITVLKDLAANNFIPEERYKNRMLNFFLYKGGHCNKLYEFLSDK